MNYYAHTAEDKHGNPRPKAEWEPLFTHDCAALSGGLCPHCYAVAPQHGHLNKVAHLAAEHAASMFLPGQTRDTARRWAYLAGLWHDLGKFAPAWQAYLASKADPHQGDISGKMDHATAGALHSHLLKPCGELFAYLIAGHHSGLPDGTPALFEKRLRKSIETWQPHALAAGVPLNETLPLPPLTRPDAGGDGLAFLTRFLFSCLVDADFLATEAFMNPAQRAQRRIWPTDIIERMHVTLETFNTTKFPAARPDDTVNVARETVRQACTDAADQRPGFFSLTVPTGGGKTLSSLIFALRHAHRHGLRRVIYVIPYTSIIQQNAKVFRDAFATLSRELGRDIVLEHHSKFDPTRETVANRLAAENWDAPLIVTTNVQFLESLFDHRSGACRKLHRIARSVVIFDEAQALPNRLLAPILRGLRCLVHDLHATVVLCTATQPALEQRLDFFIGIPPDEIHPIIADESALFLNLQRVESRQLGPLTDDELVNHIHQHAPEGCLLIVNTTKAARLLHARLSEHATAFHLSARMCPRHVMTVLARVQRERRRGRRVMLVSTQLIEAGVDISFPVVYRAECGLDSFAQAAGRCNRNGELRTAGGQPRLGCVFLFQPSEHPIPDVLPDLQAAAAVTRNHILPHYAESELLSLIAVRRYFEHAVWSAGQHHKWDEPHLVSRDMPAFPPSARPPFHSFQFARAAETFQIIPNRTHPVLIPWGRKGEALCEEIRLRDRLGLPPQRQHYRRAQHFTVQVYAGEWQHFQDRLSTHCDGAFSILEHLPNNYDSATGLKSANRPENPAAYHF